ncbi:hypothetical protein F5888DRAFT_1619644 [Russula emetica]|nr:hypothetical protein F5888DRAFT_1619644 [Russula emetica]
MVRPIHRSETFQTTFSLQASLHFCSECNNLLYPKAEQQRRTMVYACRICPNVDETVDSGLVYRNDLLNITKEQAGVTTDLAQDPTLAHTNVACPNCGHEDAVFYQDQSKRKETRMIHFYVCTRCNHNFQDKLLGSEAPIVQTSEVGPSQP